MAIQHRRGADVDFKPDRMKAGELALTTDGTRKMYAAFAPGDVKEVAFKEDIPEGGGGGGSFEQVQSNYAQTDSTQPDYIKNKLVGKEVTYSDTLTWDGNTEGLESIDMLGDGSMVFYRVSDCIPTTSDFDSGYTVIGTYNDGNTITEQDITGLSSVQEMDENSYMIGEAAIVILIDNYSPTDTLVIERKGIYLKKSDTMYVSSLTVSNYRFPTTTTKKLTAEYLEPFEVVTKGGDTLTWDGDTSGLDACEYMEDVVLYRVSDATPTLNDFVEGTKVGFTASGEIEYQDVDISKIIQEENLILDPISTNFVICLEDGTPFGDGVMNKGLYFIVASEYGMFTSYLTIPNYTGFTTTEKKLKREYLIDTNSIILKSSGGKRFKVTVSDTGTLTATEI